MLFNEAMTLEKVPEGYDLQRRGAVTLIVRNDLEWFVENENWEDPGIIVSKYASETVLEGRGKGAILRPVDGKSIFLKKMLHGGLFGSLFRSRFTSRRIIRSLDSAIALRENNLRSPEIACIILRKKLFLSEGHIGVDLVEGAQSLIRALKGAGCGDERKKRWQILKRIALDLRTFHEKGFYHLDLNGGNILIKMESEGKGEVYFIDLDRMKRYAALSAMKRLRNIWRLFRSLRKTVGEGGFDRKDEEYFMESYCVDDPETLSFFRKFIPLFRLSLLYHLPFWKFTAR